MTDTAVLNLAARLSELELRLKGCVFIGRWAAGAMCPEHRNNPLTDKTHQRNPTLIEAFESIDTDDQP